MGHPADLLTLFRRFSSRQSGRTLFSKANLTLAGEVGLKLMSDLERFTPEWQKTRDSHML